MLNNGAAIKTTDICNRLVKLHRHFGWRAEKEAMFSPRRIDVLAISPKATEVIGFEIKVSLQDFRNELKNPAKRLAVMRHCTQFYFVTPQGMVKAGDVPEDCGLIHYRPEGWLLLIKGTPHKRSELPIEAELRIAHERWRDKQKAEVEALELAYERDRAEIWDAEMYATEGEDESLADLPHWMLPRFLKPLRFQFDVLAAASSLAASYPLPPVCNFDEVPF